MPFSHCVCALPDLRAFARWNGGLRSVFVERVLAFPLIVGSVGADLLNLSGRVLKQVRQGFGIADTGHDLRYGARILIKHKGLTMPRGEQDKRPGLAVPRPI
jgi:hypothetical protein